MKIPFYRIGAIASVFLTVACNSAQKKSSDAVIASEDKQSARTNFEVSAADLKENLEYLASDELQGRSTGTEGIEKAAAYIEEDFKDNGIASYFQNYRDRFEVQGKKAFNIVGVLEGNDPQLKDQYIIIGAHYDHIGIQEAVAGDSIANGANDNAAGTVAVMELAEELAKMDNNGRSIIFALFSGEELGLTGSAHLAEVLKQENLDLYAVVNLEMIGVPMKDKEYMAYLTGFENSNFAEKFNGYAGQEILGFLPQAKEYNLFKRSDNYPFFNQFGIPAQTISTFDFTNYEYYHHAEDEAGKMNFQHMGNLVEAILPAILKMANTPEKEIKMNE
ncbi:M20/M25/M40 family metallo-hydrolase [Zunongwangia sp. F363]|uniref:M20/M25/M40 family metallo-hydrolase n=1 Tax=Autumnicola tepida TaxID=3075595 RepID=A0ABU3C547_9FLAO|nr:M20/M25/M40 family metallo-hydrolase [Zunongwangia sp. F363]MDT0641445.1 M20/M25/M40 family metallo-hydrolase [Zunongwangia sp. F363]